MHKMLYLLIIGFFTAANPVFGQEGALGRALFLYENGNFAEAALELRTIGGDSRDYAEALYWTGLCELSLANYREALAAFEALERLPSRARRTELPYHKGRLFYYLGRYEEGLVILSGYAERETDRDRKAHGLYWAGECLFAMGQFDRAENIFAQIVERYPESAKYEAASYRMELVKKKKVEAELLSILKWSHEESLKALEEYRRREKTYNQAIAAYQKRIAELESGAAASPEFSETEYRQKLAEAQERINALNKSRVEEAAVPTSGQDRDAAVRLLSIKSGALSLRNTIAEKLKESGR